MALGALIGAYQEDETGGLRALLPLAGRTLMEYQARCAAAVGASPIVILAERIPSALNEALERLRQEGISVVPVSDGSEAASRFEPTELVLLIADGLAPPLELLERIAPEQEPAVVTVPDDAEHQQFERIDAASRWSGIALVDGRTLGATAAILGEWDLQSTLLRRTLQAGALRIALASDMPDPLLAGSVEDLAGFERQLVLASRGTRTDFASRYLLAPIEDLATERLMETRVRPDWLLVAAILFTLAAAFAFTRGLLWPALLMLVLSTPLDLIARRLAALRLKPLPRRSLLKRLLWPAAGMALLGLGWWEWRDPAGWGAFFAAVAAAAFAEAARAERPDAAVPGGLWLFSRRNAIVAAIPFAAAGAWTLLLVALAVYAAGSFFFLQHLRHRIWPD